MAVNTENKTQVSRDKLTGATGGMGGSPVVYCLVRAKCDSWHNYPQIGVCTEAKYFVRRVTQGNDEWVSGDRQSYNSLWIRDVPGGKYHFVADRTSYDPPTADGE
ncbi:MAG: hypothetical protein LBJ95_04975 [Oscillospiraceae bacterium]|jgi:hypothetical protein|nr:hypothetical protein [Oscillospiraceae bacterium]